MNRRAWLVGLVALGAACSSETNVDPKNEPPPPSEPVCTNGAVSSFRFPDGSTDGHADPFGAKAAGQARAGRVRDPSMIVQPADARHKIRPGDFVLANDKIAVYIESEGVSDGYDPLGGEILALEPVGDDGKPRGVSEYGESLVMFSRQSVAPDKVTVLADGSDGKAAIVRVSGVLKNIPFLDTFSTLIRDEYDLPAAFDYVLEPGKAKVTLRVSLVNTHSEPLEAKNLLGFFHAHRGQIFTEASGYAQPKGETPWVAWDAGKSAFLVRTIDAPLRAEIEVSGFQMFSTKATTLDACQKKTYDYLDFVPGAPGIDGMLEAKRSALGEPSWREVKGKLTESGASGTALAGAIVHATDPSGRYLTRALTDATGAFTIHVPPSDVSLTPTLPGWAVPSPTALAAGAASASLTLPPRASIAVSAKDATTSEPLPVRVQVIPSTAIAAPPAAWGVTAEPNGRLWVEYPMNGAVTLPVPPGQHRVIVTRGYEYETYDQPVLAEEGKTATVDASLAHSVDSTGVMCADFHVHSYYSADAPDQPELKVRGAVADGLEIPVSSEHEWIIDFRPIIAKLGLGKWASSLPSEELTTFTWGHFGVIPKSLDENAVNNGAVNWLGRKPADIFKQVNALPDKPVLIVNHPSSSGFLGYFSASVFDRATTKGLPDLWSDEFGAIEVFNDSDLEDNRTKSVADWFALLNAGKTYWAVGNSDSHHQRTEPVGYPRTCLAFGHDDPTKLTPEGVRDVLRSGAAVVSGGLTMSVVGPGGVGPGGKAAAGKYTVTIASPSWFAATSLEVIVDGVTVDNKALGASPGPGPGKKWVVDVDVAASQSKSRHWVVFHAKGGTDLAPLHVGRKPFAVSNPIFF